MPSAAAPPAAAPPAAAQRVTATLTSLHRRAYEVHAESVALVWPDGRQLTYAELGVLARRLAGSLGAAGLQEGDRAMLVTRNRPEALLVDHGLLSGGFVRVPVSYRLHPQEIATIAEDCEPKVVFAEGERVPAVREALAAIGSPARVVCLDGHGEAADPLEAMTAGAAEVAVSPDPEDLAWLPYTSGTTGRPKGVMLAHRCLLACFRNWMAELSPIEPDDVALHVAPLTHLSGWVAHLSMVSGARQVTLVDFEPGATLDALERHRVTILPFVPTMVNLILPVLEERGNAQVRSVHTVLYGGSAIAPDRLARAVAAFGDVFVQGYGLTEVPFPLASLSKTGHRFDPCEPPPDRLSSAGRVTPFVEVRLVGPDGEDVPEGEPGEIWARTDTTMLGYWRRPEETAEVLRDGGWAATGDVGQMREGHLHIVDRKKDMIVSGGFNIFPNEVENAISTLPGVQEVAVVGAPDERWGETVNAVIVVRDGHTVTADDVERVCRERIASYKRPRAVEFVDALPKTSSGKIMRRVLRDAKWEGRSRRVGE